MLAMMTWDSRDQHLGLVTTGPGDTEGQVLIDYGVTQHSSHHRYVPMNQMPLLSLYKYKSSYMFGRSKESFCF